MFLKEVRIENYGAIKNLLLVPEQNNSQYKPIVIVGKNGSGKTLLLTQLVDSLIEMKRKKYNEIAEVRESNYYKLGSKKYIRAGELYSFVNITYENEGRSVFYTDFMTNNINLTRQTFQDGHFSNVNFFDQKLVKDGFYKSVEGEPKDNIFEENIFIYFPVHRYYTPSWYNEDNGDIGLSYDYGKIIGKSHKSIIKENVIKEIERWILELILDKYLYEEKRSTVPIIEGTTLRQGIEIISTNGKNTKLHNLLNELFKIIYQVKFKDIEYARLGISSKGDRRVSVILKPLHQEEIEIAPTFSHLSSGEAMLVALFGSLLKEFDEISSTTISDLSDVKGIVIIDEIDLNLHIEFAKEIVPQLISKFPNVQFIFTTHSPFLLLGMEENFGDGWQLVNLPEGNSISVNDFSEIKDAYNIFTKGYSELENSYCLIKEEVDKLTKTFVITEGKTDWKHLDNALRKFKEQGEFSNLDIEFYRYEDEIKMSDSELFSLLKEFSKVPNAKRIIGIFDRDQGNGKSLSKEIYKDYGNNVFGMSIPNPEHRKDHNGISIEHMYLDEDIKRIDEDGRRIYLSAEFSEVTGRHVDNLDININNITVIKGKVSDNTSKVIDANVYDKEGNSLALSKNNFANYIFNGHENFKDIDISGFRSVFEVISMIENPATKVDSAE